MPAPDYERARREMAAGPPAAPDGNGAVQKAKEEMERLHAFIMAQKVEASADAIAKQTLAQSGPQRNSASRFTRGMN